MLVRRDWGLWLSARMPPLEHSLPIAAQQTLAIDAMVRAWDAVDQTSIDAFVWYWIGAILYQPG